MGKRKPLTIEQRAYISIRTKEGMKANGVSEKIRKSNLENPRRYWLGKKFSEEHKAKLKEARNKRPPASEETRAKMSKARKGKQWSEEHRRKALESKITSIELKVAEQLKNYGIKNVPQKQLCKGHFIVDFYLPEYHLVIECNGDYWHNRPERKERDKELEEYILSKGKDILWLWEHEIKDEWFDLADYLEI